MKIIKKLLTPTIISIALFLVLFFARYGIDHYVCDSFFVTGFILVLFGGMIFVSNNGTFNLITYGTKKFIGLFKKESNFKLKYHEYVLLQEEKEKADVWPTLVVGLVYLAIGIAMSLIVVS